MPRLSHRWRVGSRPKEVKVSSPSLESSELDALTRGWWLPVLAGVVSIAAGIIILAKPSNSLATLAVISGIFILVDGIVELAMALSRRSENRGAAAVLGVLSVIVGILLIRHPIAGVVAVALLLSAWLIAAAVVRFVLAFESPEHRLRGIAVALVLAAAGIIIVASPNIGYATLALIAGLGFIGYGVGMVMLGLAIRTVHHVAAPRAHQGGLTT
jgi:uncharacterized membrane protein HdeD (DUF308 family)